MGSRDHGMVEFGVQIPMAPFDSLRSLMAGQSNLIKPFRIDDPAKFKLKDFDPADTGEIKSKLTAAKLLPERGRIGIFNRSYYEEVLVVRVHRRILEGQKIPAELIGKDIWKQRYEDINAFERHLWRDGTIVRKFFLNVSRHEQKRRFLRR